MQGCESPHALGAGICLLDPDERCPGRGSKGAVLGPIRASSLPRLPAQGTTKDQRDEKTAGSFPPVNRLRGSTQARPRVPVATGWAPIRVIRLMALPCRRRRGLQGTPQVLTIPGPRSPHVAAECE